MTTADAAEPTFYDAIGGHDTIKLIVDTFYEGVETDEVLRPLYPEEDLGPANVRFRMFLEQYWGGPTTYSNERGHPRLRMRHAPFEVTLESIPRLRGEPTPCVVAHPRDRPSAALGNALVTDVRLQPRFAQSLTSSMSQCGGRIRS